MIPAAFDYIRASSADEAVAQLQRFGGDARVLAGGQSLIPAMRFRLARPAVLVDINALADLDYIRVDGAALIGNVDSVRLRYRDRIEAHRQGLRELTRGLGWTLASHVCDHPPEPPLLALYNALSTKAQG